MHETDRLLIVQSQDQPLAIEIGLGQHELLEHGHGHRLSQPAPPGAAAPDGGKQRRIAVQERAVADHEAELVAKG